jgi:hypothetical protein
VAGRAQLNGLSMDEAGEGAPSPAPHPNCQTQTSKAEVSTWLRTGTFYLALTTRERLDGPEQPTESETRTHGISASDFYIIQVTSIKMLHQARVVCSVFRVRDQVSWRNIAITLITGWF